METLLHRLAEQILNLDEASLTSLLDKYRQKVNNFEPTREWEKAVIILFIINGVKAKNAIFNEQMLKRNASFASPQPPQRLSKQPKRPGQRRHLKVVK
jgi:hypothetical protein